MASPNDKWEGWLGHDPDSVNGKMIWGEYEPKVWEEKDVDIAVTHSSVCGTDVHVLRNDFVSTDFTPSHHQRQGDLQIRHTGKYRISSLRRPRTSR